MSKSIKNTVYPLALALLLPGTMALADTSDRVKTQKEAIELTQRVEASARSIQDNVDRLNALRVNTHIANGTHRYHLQKIALEVNDQLQPALARLAQLQPELPAWKAEAINQMRTSAATIAANAEAAVQNRKAANTRMPVATDPEYAQLLGNINERADVLIDVADATADYAEAQLQGKEAGLAITSHL